jgi:general secretion pathway protein D
MLPQRQIFLAKCLQILVLAVCAGLCAGADSAGGYFKAAERAQKGGDSLKAYLFYSRAAQLDPKNRLYAQRRDGLRASAPLTPSSILGPDPADETLETALRAEGLGDGDDPPGYRLSAPPPRLLASPDKHAFNVRGDARMIFEQVARAYGIEVMFDSAYQSPPPIIFRITDATYQDALRSLEAASDSFLIPLGSRLVMVARDTAQKRTEMMPVMSLAVPIPERISVQEAQEISTAVQQTMEIRRISMDPARRVVYFRDAVPKVLAARQMFANLSRLRTQVEIDVDFLSASKTSTLTYGLSLPTSANIVDFGTALLNRPTAAAGTFLHLAGGGGTLIGLGVADAAAFATLSKASAESVLSSQIVALDGQAATLKVGNRYPITTASFSGATASQGATFAPTVQYEDLGLMLKITPVVHEDFEVSLEVDAQFKTIGTGAANGIPVIDSRQYQGKVRLKYGEWAVIAGLVTTSDSDTRDGIPGLMNIPWLGHLFSKATHTQDSTQILLVLKPHLTALPPWEIALKPIWMGTETRPLMPF